MLSLRLSYSWRWLPHFKLYFFAIIEKLKARIESVIKETIDAIGFTKNNSTTIDATIEISDKIAIPACNTELNVPTSVVIFLKRSEDFLSRW